MKASTYLDSHNSSIRDPSCENHSKIGKNIYTKMVIFFKKSVVVKINVMSFYFTGLKCF